MLVPILVKTKHCLRTMMLLQEVHIHEYEASTKSSPAFFSHLVTEEILEMLR